MAPTEAFAASSEPAGAVRLHVPDTGETTVDDVIRGETRFPNASMDDPVIARARTVPSSTTLPSRSTISTPALTHVVRGEDHLSNTPKQLLVFEALGVAPPRYAHLPLLRWLRRPQALQASRGRLGPRAPRGRLPTGGGRQRHRPARCPVSPPTRSISACPSSPSASVWSGFPRIRRRSMSASCATSTDCTCASSGIDELTRRLEEFTGRTGLRGAVEISGGEDPDAGGLLAAGRVRVRHGLLPRPAAFAKVICGDGGVEQYVDAPR